jgi:hypothetical protein
MHLYHIVISHLSSFFSNVKIECKTIIMKYQTWRLDTASSAALSRSSGYFCKISSKQLTNCCQKTYTITSPCEYNCWCAECSPSCILLKLYNISSIDEHQKKKGQNHLIKDINTARTTLSWDKYSHGSIPEEVLSSDLQYHVGKEKSMWKMLLSRFAPLEHMMKFY